MKRCDWVTDDEVYIDYHDKEWGVPVHDDRRLFEMMILEGAQAGLSWLTILKRRDTYRKAYDGFDPLKMSRWTDATINRLLENPGIIRNRRKIEAAKTNAVAYLNIIPEFGSFASYIWSFVNGRPIQNSWRTLNEVPSETGESRAMSADLKLRGFKFVGPTICYAFMQAVGMVNDHILDCFRHNAIQVDNDKRFHQLD